jgi:amino acid permease
VISTSIFFVVPIAFNAYRIRKYGEIEFWITTIKVLTLVGLIIIGLVISTNDAASSLLGTDKSHYPLPCVNNTAGECVAAPDFLCINF